MKLNYRKIGLKRIDLYIIKKFLGTFFFSIVLILGIAVIFDLSEKLDNFFDNNAPLDKIIFDYYFNFIPFYLNMLTPLFTFLSVIFFTSKLAGNTEIIAMLASGISFRRLMLPYAIAAGIIFVMSFFLGGYIIPPSNEELLEFENQYVKKFKSNYARNIQMEIEPGIILYIERFEIDQNRGFRMSLEKFEDKKLISRLTAETVKWDSAYHWTIEDYMKRDFQGMREYLTRGTSLDTVIKVQPSEFFISSRESAQLNNQELSQHISRLKHRGIGNTKAFEDEYYKRFSMPLAVFIMTLMGVSLSSRKVRGGMGLNLGIGLALSAIYILFSTLSTSFSVSGAMSPLMAVWLPNILFLGVGIYLYRTTPK
ncbi:MAG: LptF/LptG family permease [Paludibacter sp.]|jgi:lipopolysaccharide export system permease protein|nr:LptF/LptG family permease [Paludibacter sp.]